MHPIAQQYLGLTLSEREQNLRDDSYFHITVWNADESKPESHEYAATAYGGVGAMSSHTRMQLLAATHDSVKRAYSSWEAQQDRRIAAEQLLRGLGSDAFGRCYKGDTVRVVRGRKVPKGTVGKVIRVVEKVTHVSRYGTWETKELFAMIVTPTGAWEVKSEYCEIVERGPVLQELFDLAS